MSRFEMKEEAAKYDFLIVGAGLYGASVARVLHDRGFRVLVAERRNNVGGNAHTEEVDGILVHRYGPHIFHTDNEEVWRFVNRFASFNSFINRPAAEYEGSLYTLPFNMNTFRQMWGVHERRSAEAIIRSQIEASGLCGKEPENLEEQAIMMAGTDIYEKLIKGYTEKHWGRSCKDLPASIIRRVAVRYDYNDNYYDDRYQGIPQDGYTKMTERMLNDIDTITGIDFDDSVSRAYLEGMADRIVYTGSIDAYYRYCFGKLQYRSVRFEDERIECRGYYQDRAVINYCGSSPAWTRITEHSHFTKPEGAPADNFTIVTREYPEEWNAGKERMYPVSDKRNIDLYNRYYKLAMSENKVTFGGRLGSYRYYDMDDVIASALKDAERLIEKR